jgi:nucleotide-binding universal stress UspA family protein
MLSKILVATDFSAHAESATQHAVALAKRFDAELVLLHVNTPPEPPPAGAALSSQAISQVTTLIEKIHAESAQELEAFATKLRSAGAKVSTKLAVDHPDAAIAETASEVDAGLVVTGSHGRTGIQRFLLGSTAERVVRLSEIPVLVSRPPLPEASAFRRVLVPTDFSPASERALQLATHLASPDAVIDIMHVWQFPARAQALLGSPSAVHGSVQDELLAALEDRADELRERYRREEQTIQIVQEIGPPAAKIQDRLEEASDYDLVALGSHGDRGFRRLFLGSVAERIVRHAPCSVLVCRPTLAGAEEEEE